MKKVKKLRYKLMIVFLSLMILTLICVIAVTHSKSLSVIREQSLQLNRRLVATGVEKLDTSYTQLNRIYQSVYLNEDFRELLRRQNRSTSLNSDAELAKNVFLSVLSSRTDLYSMIFIDMQGRLFYATRDEAGFYPDYRSCALPEEYLQQLTHLDEWQSGLRLLPTHEHMPLRSTDTAAPLVYSAARKIVNTELGFSDAGILFITIDLSDMERLTDLIRPDDSSVTYIANTDGRVIFDSSGERTGGNLPKAFLDRLSGDMLQDVTLRDGKPYVMVWARAEASDWYVLTLIPEAAYAADALHVSTSILVTALIAVFLVIVFTTLTSRMISRPIEDLASVMGQSGLQDLGRRVEIGGNDEIAQLGERFNHLMENLQTSIHNEYELQLQQKEATIRALQAQLNPHFLYNVLQSMGSIALVNGVPEISAMSTALGNILRYNIKGENALTTVRDELAYTRDYLSIQKIRFGDRLDYLIDIPEYIMQGLIPRVSIQPMVENAIIHGFEQRQEPGTICIRGWTADDRLLIEVADDGQGIAPERLAQIRSQLTCLDDRAQTPALGIGIRNLYARLKLLYETAGALRIESEPDVGTVIQIEVPFIKG